MQNSNRIRPLILIMAIIVVIVIVIARQYYKSQNRWIDPRVVPARELYAKYNTLAVENDLPGVLDLLDSIEVIYSKYPHYRNSFEMGVLENNRAAVYLTMIIAKEQKIHNNKSLVGHEEAFREDSLALDSLIHFADLTIRKSIEYYETWQRINKDSLGSAIGSRIKEDFYYGLELSTSDAEEKYLNKRIQEIQKAQLELPRRLSVAYTNLGVVYRYRGDYKEAAEKYRYALELWEDNLSAENNLNHLLGLPIKKRNFIQKMFPQER